MPEERVLGRTAFVGYSPCWEATNTLLPVAVELDLYFCPGSSRAYGCATKFATLPIEIVSVSLR